MNGFSRFCIFFGFLLLFHSGYSAVQHKTYLKLTEQPFVGLPHDITIECIIGTILCVIGGVLASESPQSIQVTNEFSKKTFDDINTRPDFIIFQHRGRSFLQHYLQELQKDK